MGSKETVDASVQALPERILAALAIKPAQKATELAAQLGVERREVNRCLSHSLVGKVRQDSGYRWRLHKDAVAEAAGVDGTAAKATEIGRLCGYFLECIGQDSDVGVSVFAASHYGDPDYAELPALPMVGSDWDWCSAPGVARVLSKVKADRANLKGWLGYPVRLREHRTAKWRGFFVEPVMLWPIELPENPGDSYRLGDELPIPNFAVLRSVAMGDASAVVEEAARLDEDLGLNSPIEDRPETDEVIDRLVSIRPDWDWHEVIDPETCSKGVSLAEIGHSGIYNRAVILPGKRSPYTQGLESELKNLGDIDESRIQQTALGRWLSGSLDVPSGPDDQPLIEVLPMNAEQRAAVKSALSAQHTVVTGPPGTGKSQVVTNILVNAAWRGMKVLFASKNNKAVDVVEARVNGLGNRPVLIRLGSKEYQAKLANYLTAMLSGHVSQDDQGRYQEGLARHHQLADKFAELELVQQKTLDARNQVDRLEAAVESFRNLLSPERFNALDEVELDLGLTKLHEFSTALDAIDPATHGLFGRFILSVFRARRVTALRDANTRLASLVDHLGQPNLDLPDRPAGVPEIRAWAIDLYGRIDAARKVVEYQKALEVLRASSAFEEIARQRHDLTNHVADNSISLWRDWVQLVPSRLTTEQRKDIADYAALLQIMLGQDSAMINSNVRSRARTLQAKVSALFSCWAVTSLSARGKIPFDPGHFDLVVIDEASQCDIASALPLLFRAKRAVIIGDPMQLRHISAVTRQKDADLLNKYGLVDGRATWMYSVNSLYDVAAGVASAAHIINLRDHHRSHANIIEFSNRTFYEGRLRVATRYAELKRPRGQETGVVWQDVKGKTVRPSGSGAQNLVEAKAVIEALNDLLVARRYQGTVGVVTPFRAQAQLIQTLVSQHPAVADVANRTALLVDTVHRFQGDERDVIFFSPVVSDGVPASALAFLRGNGNLFNVAITRARGLLHVIGDRSAAATSGVDYLEKFAVYVGQIGAKSKLDTGQGFEAGGPEFPSVSRPERVSDWERILYGALYAAGVRPIPQFSVEQYDLDFAVIVGEQRLNIEVDGERYHRSWTGELCLRDQLRNQRLIELGWEVKRFWVYEVRDRLPEVVQQVVTWVDKARQHGVVGLNHFVKICK